MNNQLLGPGTTIAETLRQMPQASRIFMQYHTGCVGCFLARFCTLKEMADAYQIDLPSFLEALRCSSSLPANEFEKGD